MNPEFFKEIGKCPSHQEECENTVSAEKIYQIVTGKIDKRKKAKKRIRNILWGLTATAAVFVLSFVGWNLWRYSGEQNADLDKIILYTYAAKGAGGPANSAQEEELEKKEVTDEEVVLGEFNTLLGSSIGFPVMFINSGDDNPEAKVSVQITQGRLLRWNRYTGLVEELGQKGEFQCGEEIYWSPPDEEREIKNAVIEASLLIGNKKVDTVRAKLKYEDYVYTMVKIEEEEEE